MTGLTMISAGGAHVGARVGSETLGWGGHRRSRIGDGTTDGRHLPVAVRA